MEEKLFIVGNKELSIKEKYDLILKHYGAGYVELLGVIVSMAGRSRLISIRTPLPGQEWSRRVSDLIGSLMDDDLNPLPPEWMKSHVAIIAGYKRWLKNHHADVPKRAVSRKYKRKTSSELRESFKALCVKEGERIKAIGGIQEELMLPPGHTDNRPRKSAKCRRRDKFPRPINLVFDGLLDPD